MDLADAGAREELLRVRRERHLGQSVLVTRRDASLGGVKALEVPSRLETGEELGPAGDECELEWTGGASEDRAAGLLGEGIVVEGRRGTARGGRHC